MYYIKQNKPNYMQIYYIIIKKVKSSINIEEIGRRDIRIRRTATGSLLIQIAGEESKRKADALAEKMRKVVGEEARVGRPSRMAEVRISGLDEDTTLKDVVTVVTIIDTESAKGRTLERVL